MMMVLLVHPHLIPEDMSVALPFHDDMVDLAPVGQSTDITVINEQVGLDLPGEIIVVLCAVLLGIIAVHGPEVDATLMTPLDGLVKEFSLPAGPEDELVMMPLKHLQRLRGERTFLADLRISVLYYRSVKIYCYYHSKM